MMFKSRVKSAAMFFRYAIMPVLTFSLVVGAVVGTVVNLYNYLALNIATLTSNIYGYVNKNLWSLPLLIIGLVAIALIIAAFLKLTPECRGSGIPRTEGVLRGLLTFRWLRVFLTTVINTSLAFLSGMSLGTEGPSIQLGATLADGIASRPYLRSVWHKYIMTGGAAAGMAVAFNAPLTGIVFALEEVHRKFSPYLLIITSLTVLVATSISQLISTALGVPLIIFDIGAMAALPLSKFWVMLVLGLVIGLAACLFNIMLTRLGTYIAKIKKLPSAIKLIFATVISGLIGLLVPSSLGSGHDLIMDTAHMQVSPGNMALLFAIKIFLIALCFNSGATGGLFLPMLTLGALVGGLLGSVFLRCGVIAPEQFSSMVIIGMAAFVGASTRAPITAMVLIVEITAQFNGFLMIGFAIVLACLVPHILRVPPLYDSLLLKIAEAELAHEPPVYVDKMAFTASK